MLSVALTIAGSDSGGGAGIQADLKTFHEFGVFGTSVLTAVTAQNTLGVHAVQTLDSDLVRAQMTAVVDDLNPSACKTGMLATTAIVETVAELIRDSGLNNYVLDPVMVATSGHRLLDKAAERSILEHLIPLCRVATPNLEEAELLTGHPVRNEDDMLRAADALLTAGAGAVLLKGGHLTGAEVVDLYREGGTTRLWRRQRLETRNTHGTGCTLSAAIAAGLARGRPAPQAVESGLEYVYRAIASAPGLGAGNGPLNHMVSAEHE